MSFYNGAEKSFEIFVIVSYNENWQRFSWYSFAKVTKTSWIYLNGHSTHEESRIAAFLSSIYKSLRFFCGYI